MHHKKFSVNETKRIASECVNNFLKKKTNKTETQELSNFYIFVAEKDVFFFTFFSRFKFDVHKSVFYVVVDDYGNKNKMLMDSETRFSQK